MKKNVAIRSDFGPYHVAIEMCKCRLKRSLAQNEKSHVSYLKEKKMETKPAKSC